MEHEHGARWDLGKSVNTKGQEEMTLVGWHFVKVHMDQTSARVHSSVEVY